LYWRARPSALCSKYAREKEPRLQPRGLNPFVGSRTLNLVNNSAKVERIAGFDGKLGRGLFIAGATALPRCGGRG